MILLGCASGRVERCAENEEIEGGRCVAVCAESERLTRTGGCEPNCPDGKVAVGDECRPACPNGQEYYEEECVTACAPLEQRIDGECRGPGDVRVNGVGYATGSEKIAVISKAPGAVTVVNLDDGTVVFEGEATGSERDPETAAELWRFDFSEVDAPGSYRVETETAGESPSFQIGPNPYAEALELSMLGFYGLRCGSSVGFEHAGDTFEHGDCHVNDGFESVSSDRKIASTGGWHDAGDYGKYTQNGAFSAGMLLLAFEHFGAALGELELPDLPEHGGAIPDFLAEVKWELDWLLTMQLDDGSTYHKLTGLSFEGFVAPEADTRARYMAPPGSSATGSFVAVMAMAARVYEPYDSEFAARCLAAAERGYGFLRDNPGLLMPDLSDFSTGTYQSDDSDDRLWAAAELWVTTGDAAALQDFEGRVSTPRVLDDWDWGNVSNLALFSYATSERDGKDGDLSATVNEAIVASADRLVLVADEHPFLRALGATYYWGANGLVARTLLNLGVAHRLSGNEDYPRVAQHQLGHLLGVNAHGRSFVTGVGFLPPLAPHHRPSGADAVVAPWPGLLVGGPNPQIPTHDPSAAAVVPDPDAPAALQWQDDQRSYWTNEIAVNWNAPLVYGLAWFYAP